ncbi:hypothetical protein L7F22_043869 [Adiantum nelumboides]|nr:hypothetical protein [Adiantum nelumboides]
MQAPLNPIALPVTVDTTGAKILEGSVAEHDSRDIYLPNHVETVSHIAIDVGGSLAKVVYFTRIARPTTTPSSSLNDARPNSPLHKHGLQERQPSPPIAGGGIPLGARSPASPASMSSSRIHSRESSANVAQSDQKSSNHIQRQPSRSQLSNHGIPIAHTAEAKIVTITITGGRLNFVKFETADITSCVNFLKELINLSAKANNVTLAQMRQGVKLMATGGGAHLFNDLFEEELGVEVRREDEMQCLITGLNFITLIPDETFYYSDELVDNLSATSPGTQTKRQDPSSAASSSSSSLLTPNGAPSPTPQTDLPRPSPDPPLYSPAFDSSPLPKLPCLLVNIGSGVSIIKVDEDGKFERVSGTSLGGGTLWGLLSLVTDAESFDEMLEMASRGDNGTVDMLVSDVYGSSDALSNLGLKSTTIASSFGKVFRKDKGDGESLHRGQAREERSRKFKQEDICKSLLYAISNNIGQIAYMNAEKFGLDRIYFGGCFIRGHQATIATLSYAIRFWSKGTKRAFFLRHEGYLGALGAWIRQFYDGNGVPNTPTNAKVAAQHAFNQLVPNQDATDLSDSTPKPTAEESNSNEATPRQTRDGGPARSYAATPAMSRQQSGPAHLKIQSPTSNGDGKINSILAEALGGVSLENDVKSTHHKQDERGQQADELHDVTVSGKDMAALQSVNESNGNREEETKDLLQLVQSLSAEDRELFSQFSELQNNANGNGTESEDGPSIADLLKNMDYVDGAADGLEGKLDGLLFRLDALLQDVEEE